MQFLLGLVASQPVIERTYKQYLKSCVYKVWASVYGPPHAFCIMSLRLTLCSEVKPLAEPKRKRVLIARLKLHEVDPKLSDLTMARLNQR